MLGLRRAWWCTAPMAWTKSRLAVQPELPKCATHKYTYEVTPEEFDLALERRWKQSSGGDASANAAIIHEVQGENPARRDIVLMNAAAALVAAGRADHLREAMPLAARSIDSGAAKVKLHALAEFTHRPSGPITSNDSPSPALSS
jgi:anthranilate phosphoribosyltransferase